MKLLSSTLILFLAVLLPTAASAQSDRGADSYRLRRELEEAAERQRILRKQEYTRSTARKPMMPATQPASPSGGLMERYILLEARINKLHADREQAIQGGKPDEEIASIDSQIERLRLQADNLRTALGAKR